MKSQLLVCSRSAFLGVAVALLLCAVQGCSTLPKDADIMDRRSGVQREDRVIESRAALRLRNEPGSAGGHLTISSYNRHVLVTGEVADGATRTRIANEIMGIENVQGVWNELTLMDHNSLAVPINDSLVASRVKTRFTDAGSSVADNVKVVTEAGVAFLLGIVNAQEAQDAIQAARTTDGVRYVVNVMQIFSNEEIERIDAALRPPVPVATPCNCTEVVPASRVSSGRNAR